MIKRVNKKAQVTIFIIVALVIVVLGVLIYVFYPQIKSTFGGSFKNPQAFMQECLTDDVKNSVDILSLQGGSLNPEHYILYDNSKIEYLCYTNEDYKTCIVQQPMLDAHIEKELKEGLTQNIDACFESMKTSYEKQGYTVVLQKKDFSFDIQLKQIVLETNSSLRLTKDSTQNYDSFRIGFNNNLYELISIANNIIEWETKVGDAETTLYMDAYHDLKVEKKKQTDGTKVYILTNRDSGNKFQFASRSVAWPPGFGGIA
jgi:hypothetical protein